MRLSGSGFTDGVYVYRISGNALVYNYYNYRYQLTSELINFLNRFSDSGGY